MRLPRSPIYPISAAPGITKNEMLAFFKTVFTAVWAGVNSTEMVELLGGSSLTLSEDPGVNYIPADYTGTITPPDVAAYKAADVNNVLFTAGGLQNDLSVDDFISLDLPRIPTKYDNAAPHNLRMIGLLDPVVYPTLTTAQKKKISNYMDLWVFYWGVWYDAGNFDKENRTI